MAISSISAGAAHEGYSVQRCPLEKSKYLFSNLYWQDLEENLLIAVHRRFDCDECG